MENRHKDWNYILNSVITSVCLILVSLLIAICCIVPVHSVNALTKEDITNNYNINFISAKTKLPVASNYDKLLLTGKKGNNATAPQFYGYQYMYNQTSNLYYETDYSNYPTDPNGYTSFNLSPNKLLEPCEESYDGYIPYGAKYFKNVDGQLEKIYENFDQNDYVLINNYTNLNANSEFNVENIYLAFGSSQIEKYDTSAPLYSLQVTGTLYSATGTHILRLNNPSSSEIGRNAGGIAIKSYYWFQYFDLHNLQGLETNENNQSFYDIDNQEGKYVFTFTFMRYDGNKVPVSETPETFEYSFYVIDANNYDSYPTIYNASPEQSGENTTTIYYNSFNTDLPYVTYEPSKYNLSYSRSNRSIAENVTSVYSQNKYNFGGKFYDKGIITYRNENKTIKEVYILTYTADNNSAVEYLYLSRLYPTTTINPTSYTEFQNLLESSELTFEYKLSQFVTVDNNTYTYTTYKTTTFANYMLGVDDDNNYRYDNNEIDHYSIIVEDNTYYYGSISDENKIANFVEKSSEDILDDLSTTHGIQVNPQNLANIGIAEQSTPEENNIIYKFEVDNGQIVEKYLDQYQSTHTINLPLSTTNDGTFILQDSINANIKFEYTVVNETVNSIKLILSNYSTATYNPNNTHINGRLLNNILDVTKYTLTPYYEYTFEDLGIHNITYSYIVRTSSTDFTINSVENNSLSTNYTTPKNFALVSYPQSLETNETTDTHSQNISYTAIGKVGVYKANCVTLNGIEYDTSSSIIPEYASANPNYDATNNTLCIEYPLAQVIITETNTTYQYSFNNIENYRQLVIKTITYKYSLTSGLSNFVDLNSSRYTELKAIIDTIKSYPTGIDADADKHILTTTEVYFKDTIQGHDQLETFGSIAYFNKDNINTDNGYSKLQLEDVQHEKYFIADYTQRIINSTYYDYDTNILESSNDTLSFSEFTSEIDVFKGFTEKLELTKEDLIITDVTPVLWSNFSTPYYFNSKKSISKIYRYTDYTFNNGIISPIGDPEVNVFTKDTYCQFDGLYEIVVCFTYDGYTDNNTIFFQVFAFIIDNSSPTITIETQNPKTTEWELFELAKYTNRNVRLSWNVPSYFQHDVYIDIDKEYFGTTITTNNYTSTFKQLNISTSKGNSNYANATTKMIRDNNKYYVTIALPTNNINGYTLDGNYKIVVHYNSNGKSTFTKTFVIDTMDISNTRVLPVAQSNDGTYKLNTTLDYDQTKQIVNFNFTFRYSPKLSGANIYTYYDKIELTSNSNIEQIVRDNDKMGITTKYNVKGNEASVGSRYNYDPNNSITDNYVAPQNFFTSNSSCIYLFRMIDDAGNESRFVLFYDKTEPRFLISPELDNINHIINDTTAVVWGDYKAIEITNSNTFSAIYESVFKNATITNTKAKTNGNIDIDDALLDKTYIDADYRLALMLGYMNSNSSLFYNIKISKIADKYYILLPNDGAAVKDSTFNQVVNVSSVNNLYLFPTNPIIYENEQYYIELPVFDDNYNVTLNTGSVVKERYPLVVIGNTPQYQITEMVNFLGKSIERYITATFVKNSSQITIQGIIGEGEYTYTIYDKLGNKTSGKLWMNLDKTQTFGFGIFDYSDNLSHAVQLGAGGSFSTSKLFISSKKSDNDTIPEYEVTYKYYAYDSQLYSDYNVKAVEIITKDIDNTLVDQETKLKLTLTLKTNINTEKIVYVPLLDEDGNDYPINSYPYSLEGSAIVANADGTEKDIYSEGVNSYINSAEPDRLYSLALNTTTDSNKQKIVTEEGLYIIKRTYLDKEIDLGTDNRIIYLSYYVDRGGIINISTQNSVASKLYEVGEQIKFELGSNYSNANYKKLIDAISIQNAQTSNSNNYSNSDFSAKNLFDTNKIQVSFNMSYDKYYFQGFYDTNNNNVIALANNNNDIINYLQTRLFNINYFKNNLYKLQLVLSIGKDEILIDETDSARPTYSQKGFNQYLRNAININNNTTVINNEQNVVKQRETNNFAFFYDTVSSYDITLNDLSGYTQFESDNQTIKQDNYLCNSLEITFDINHNAPSGDMYGKYYGRHNYDNNKTDDNTTIAGMSSIPTVVDEKGDLQYALLTKYLSDGQLQPLSDKDKAISLDSTNNNYVTLYSTNNETLVFVFAITNDEYEAKIDIDNIKIYQGAINDGNLIFNRTNGAFVDTSLINTSRQSQSFISNVIDGVTYYAIIIFDNNLDEILDQSELTTTNYSNYRLLNAEQNIDNITYYAKINYVGNAEDYQGLNNNQTTSFYSTTYEISIDRIKPKYNLTKLMSLDRYVYNTVTQTPTPSTFEALFESYKPFYNFVTDEDYSFDRSDIENYFFALDYRPKTSFVFETINEFDSNYSLFFRKVDKNNYKFSVTPDDYKSYYNATYLQGHPQFTPSNAITITSDNIQRLNSPNINEKMVIEFNKYYQVLFALDANTQNGISASYLINNHIFDTNSYYEIIEQDEAGNYRVYAVYIPELNNSQIQYSYQLNSNASSLQQISLSPSIDPSSTASGMKMQFVNIKTKDNFVRVDFVISSSKLNVNIQIQLNPNDLKVYVIDRTTSQGKLVSTYNIGTLDTNSFTNTSAVITAINDLLEYYDGIISNKTSQYYSEYGYTVYITVIDRIGINVAGTLFNYKVTYNVAGSTLTPTFIDGTHSFTMRLSGQKGSTYLTNIAVYKFNKTWEQIATDNSSTAQSFSKSEKELKKPIDYILTRGVYKFVFTDNFSRVSTFFHEFGISSSQTGGSLKYTGAYYKNSDGYTYTGKSVEYSYDSSVYNVYIKFAGLSPSEDYDDQYIMISDSENRVVFSSNTTYTDAYLKEFFGISTTTNGNITTIKFSGVKDNSKLAGVTDLSKYHIKTILASNSTDYTWNKEQLDSNYYVYDKQIALYSVVPRVTIKNISGNTLNTNEHLNLTEDFLLVTMWDQSVNIDERFDFNSKICLTRTYNDNGTIKSTTSYVTSGTLIREPGEYTAYTINDLGIISKAISFTRGLGEISMYAVYAVDTTQSTETKLAPSSLIETNANDSKIIFSYFITTDYLHFIDIDAETEIVIDDFALYSTMDNLSSRIKPNKDAIRYIDVRVNSNLSIFVELDSVGIYNESYIFVQYKIYSVSKNNEEFIYRYARIIFVPNDESRSIVKTSIIEAMGTNDVTDSVIKSTDSSISLRFDFVDENEILLSPIGDTTYIDRYYNGIYVTTYVTNIDMETTLPLDITITDVGLHEFIIRDLAGRYQRYGSQASGYTQKLQVYLINQVMFNVNNNLPINNQIFNDEVKINVVSELAGLTLYSTRSLSISVTKNGEELTAINNNTEITLTDPGYYTIKFSATTSLSTLGSSIIDQEISSTYSFIIIDKNIATKSFSVSKGTGFAIEKLIKNVNGEKYEMTDTYISEDSLLWLTYEDQGNSIFDVTLKSYNTSTQSYDLFTFSIWINAERPDIISSIPNGGNSKKTIIVNYNPGLIYNQIGNGYIMVNDKKVYTINENSSYEVESITIDEKGTYSIKIYTNDGTLISSYKFTKNDPINKVTKLIIVCVCIGVAVLVGLFFFLRRKGKYR